LFVLNGIAPGAEPQLPAACGVKPLYGLNVLPDSSA